MSPAYQRDSKWYFELYGAEYGPFDTQGDAEYAYGQVLQSNCPTCEGD